MPNTCRTIPCSWICILTTGLSSSTMLFTEQSKKSDRGGPGGAEMQ